jgi:hypothetical protein
MEDAFIPYVPPVAKEWLTFGSEKEIDEETITEHRKKVLVCSSFLSTIAYHVLSWQV